MLPHQVTDERHTRSICNSMFAGQEGGKADWTEEPWSSTLNIKPAKPPSAAAHPALRQSDYRASVNDKTVVEFNSVHVRSFIDWCMLIHTQAKWTW